jgi:hypothetical protein
MHYSSTILFFFMASHQYLESRQLSFGISGSLIAAAPRIGAMHTLISMMAKQPAYAIEVHDGIINQFVRAALNGSQNDAVMLLSDKYVHDESGMFNFISSGLIAPDFSAEITKILQGRVFVNQARVRIMKGAPFAKAFHAFATAAGASIVDDNEPVDCLVLDTEFDTERPVDACMDVALSLHSTVFKSNGFVMMRKGCDEIAIANLRLLGATELAADELFSLWQLECRS